MIFLSALGVAISAGRITSGPPWLLSGILLSIHRSDEPSYPVDLGFVGLSILQLTAGTLRAVQWPDNSRDTAQ
jgi:hypothetical protein